MPGWAWIIIIPAGLFAADRLGLWMEARGWLYWRKGSGGADVFAAMSFTDPGARHAVEARQERAGEEDEDDGDDDGKRGLNDQVS